MTTISPTVLPAVTSLSIWPRVLRGTMTLPTSRRSAGRRAIATAPLAPIRSFVALLDISHSIRLWRIVLVRYRGGRDERGRLAEAAGAIHADHLPVLEDAQSTYGRFATVITMLWWFYLQSMITLLGAQLNVVLKEHSYPRSLT